MPPIAFSVQSSCFLMRCSLICRTQIDSTALSCGLLLISIPLEGPSKTYASSRGHVSVSLDSLLNDQVHSL